MSKYDLVVIGGGIIGLATALKFTELYPEKKVAIIDKESKVGYHQSGHNSGVIHAGIYYTPGTQKANFCRAGSSKLKKYCDTKDIPYKLCGKIIVATDEDEVPVLENLYHRGVDNGVPELELIDSIKLKELEPNASGIKAILSPNTGIVDYKLVAQTIANDLISTDTDLLLKTSVLSQETKEDGIYLETNNQPIKTNYLINCGGLHADRLANKMGFKTNLKIIPFRGEFFSLKPEQSNLVNGLIYPVPNPKLPFLGVHFTKRIDGSVEAGPNAVFAFAREGYKKTHINMRDLTEILMFPGFWKMSANYWSIGIGEQWRSLVKSVFVKSLQKLVPSIEKSDLITPSAGVRAQAVERNGTLVQDFRIVSDENTIHVLNAPSPGATSCFAIAEHILDTCKHVFKL